MAKIPSQVLVAVVALCLVHQIAAKSVTTPRHFPGKDVFAVESSLRRTTLAYMVCEKSAKADRKCEVVREDAGKKSTCEVTLKLGDNLNKPKVIPFGEDKAVVMSSYKTDDKVQMLKFTTVQFPKCKVNAADVKLTEEIPTIVINMIAYDHSFEAYFKSQSLCKDKLCRVSFDADGKLVSGPAGWAEGKIGDIIMLAAASSESSDKGIAIPSINMAKRVIELSFARNGVIKKFEDIPVTGGVVIALNAEHDFVSICTRTDMTFCTQFDYNGASPKMEVKLDDVEQIVGGQAVHSLPGGGLLMTAYAPKTNKYSVKKFSAAGKLVGTVDFPDFKCNNDGYLATGRFFGQGNEHCLSLLCSEFADGGAKDPGHLDVTTNCYSDKDFTK